MLLNCVAGPQSWGAATAPPEAGATKNDAAIAAVTMVVTNEARRKETPLMDPPCSLEIKGSASRGDFNILAR